DSRIGRQRFISLLFLLRARRVTGGKTTSTIRISPLLPQSGPNACAQRNETGSPETTSKTLSIATSHQPRLSLPRPAVAGGVRAPAGFIPQRPVEGVPREADHPRLYCRFLLKSIAGVVDREGP